MCSTAKSVRVFGTSGPVTSSFSSHGSIALDVMYPHLAPGAPMLGKPECPWSPNLAEDAARIGSVTVQAACIRVPWLLVHGDADELVPYQDALDARAATLSGYHGEEVDRKLDETSWLTADNNK